MRCTSVRRDRATAVRVQIVIILISRDASYLSTAAASRQSSLCTFFYALDFRTSKPNAFLRSTADASDRLIEQFVGDL